MTSEAFDLTGKSFLVTGGTGSFGQRFVQLLIEKYAPRRVIVYSRDELKQYEMGLEVRHPNLRYFLGDVRDYDRLCRALDGIDIVVHAAALKQVPAAEYNPIECIKTNVIGAENVLNACIDSGVKRCIALSTDKAVNPINLYGASKLCSDKLFVAANHLAAHSGCRFSVVRYGNVVGSRGSVIPFFREQAKTGKLPITDARMTRFWITLTQGTHFVAQCLRLMRGGEIFVSKIPSMKVTDLAAAIGPDCELVYTGIRPGEKLHEVMVPSDEAKRTLEFDSYYLIQPDFHWWNKDEGAVYGDEEGRPVAEDFHYASNTNKDWVTVDDLKRLID